MFNLPRPVWLLGWVSLATDAAGEAIYPLLPFFLTNVLGATAVALGVVEGAAEAANSLLKIVSGRLADRGGAKRRLVLLGYSVSSMARPLIAITTTWTQVFAVRVADRVGKGVRGAPRDAMLATWATPATRGKVYGFHQGMDNLGAVVGPALASLFLWLYPGAYRPLFTLTIVPGAIAVALIFLLPDESRAKPGAIAAHGSAKANPGGLDRMHLDQPAIVNAPLTPSSNSTRDDAPLPRRFHGFMAVLAVFMLGNSTDAFLLLRLTDAAGSAVFVPLMWAGINVVKTIVSMLGGSWSDRIGRRSVIAVGWLVYAVVYAGFAVSSTLPALLSWFLVYGFYFGFAEGTEKALVADLAPVSKRGTAFGVYNAVSGLGALTASIVFGVIWKVFGAPAAFGTGAALAFAATALLFIVVPRHTADA
jgi:MFS family permease